MNIYAVICTRSNKFPITLQKEINYFLNADVKPKIIIGASSIFDSYSKVASSDYLKDEDIVLFCHDDILFMEPSSVFRRTIIEALNKPKTGFIGLAGTEEFNSDCIWWQNERSKLKGTVHHATKDGKIYPTVYGPAGHVAVLDGLFLGCRVENLKKISLTRPPTFSGNWDFYDIYYTIQMTLNGYINRVINLHCLHESPGELTGRNSWHENRIACQQLFKNYFPIISHEYRPPQYK